MWESKVTKKPSETSFEFALVPRTKDCILTNEQTVKTSLSTQYSGSAVWICLGASESFSFLCWNFFNTFQHDMETRLVQTLTVSYALWALGTAWSLQSLAVGHHFCWPLQSEIWKKNRSSIQLTMLSSTVQSKFDIILSRYNWMLRKCPNKKGTISLLKASQNEVISSSSSVRWLFRARMMHVLTRHVCRVMESCSLGQ